MLWKGDGTLVSGCKKSEVHHQVVAGHIEYVTNDDE